MQVCNVLRAACWKYRTRKIAKNSPSGCHCTTICQDTLQRSSLNLDIGCESFMDVHFAGKFTCLAELLHILILVLRVKGPPCWACRWTLVSPRYLEALALPGMYDIAGEAHMEGTCLGQHRGQAVLSCVLLGIMHGFETWTVAKSGARWLNIFNTWSVHKIIWILYTRHVTNTTLRETTICPPVSSVIHLVHGTSVFQMGSTLSQCVTLTTSSLEKTSRALMYHLVEGISVQSSSIRIQGWQLHTLTTYHWLGSTLSWSTPLKKEHKNSCFHITWKVFLLTPF